MRAEEEISSRMMDPWSIFLYGMKAPMTRGNIEEDSPNFLIS
jgi:hypothetical protein